MEGKLNKNGYSVYPIGKLMGDPEKNEFWIEIESKYRKAMTEMDKYSHIHVIWFAHESDSEDARNHLVDDAFPPFYGDNVPPMGVFATRSPERPNPILFTACRVTEVDKKKGIIRIAYIDAIPGSPIIDIKPYIGMSDLIESAELPVYLQHWPRTNEKAMEYFAGQDAE